jgi:hypothetical protein
VRCEAKDLTPLGELGVKEVEVKVKVEKHLKFSVKNEIPF